MIFVSILFYLFVIQIHYYYYCRCNLFVLCLNIKFLPGTSTMATEWKKAKELDPKVQMLVFGFVRISQKTFDDSSSSIMMIPDLIIFIILSFYQLKDEWDEINTDKSSYTINDDCVTKTVENHKSALLKHILLEGYIYMVIQN